MTFEELRERYGTFSYDGFEIKKESDGIRLSFDFSIVGLCRFNPQTKIMTDNLEIINSFDSDTAKNIVFSLGMVEAVSYWKASCPKQFDVRCGYLDDEQKLWWKKLWFRGLSEFFFRNGIRTDFDSFVRIDTLNESPFKGDGVFRSGGISIVPVGGGKDSAVTLGILSEIKSKIKCFTVNDQQARTDTVLAAGLSENDIIRTYRTIDKELLRLNSEGFLNGHTPFSAIVAFLSLYCAYLTGAENIMLSNESSANESNISGTEVNHQYSKSYEFERDFTDYAEKYLGAPIKYFSILRPFNELQIAKKFASLPQYHQIFRSCNVGSKKNIWCCNCAKCLFVCIILSPFTEKDELIKIFGCDMLDKGGLASDFEGLAGISGVKPFECIGTVDEITFALGLTIKKYRENGEELPCLLKLYDDKCGETSGNIALLSEYNEENNVPDEFIKYVKEMYRFVSDSD